MSPSPLWLLRSGALALRTMRESFRYGCSGRGQRPSDERALSRYDSPKPPPSCWRPSSVARLYWPGPPRLAAAHFCMCARKKPTEMQTLSVY